MLTFLIRRLLQTVAFILLTTFFLYTLLVMLMPGGPYRQYERYLAQYAEISGRSDLEFTSPELTHLQQVWKLDRPWPLNFAAWLFDPNEATQLTEINENYEEVPVKAVDIKIGDFHLKGSGALTGTFGRPDRVLTGNTIVELIRDLGGNTLLLMGGSLLLSIFVAVPLGAIAAFKQRSIFDHALTFFSFAGFSMPPFMLGGLLVMFLAILPYLWHTVNGLTWIPYLPPGQVADLDQSGNMVNRVYHLALPVLALSVPQIVLLSRQVRASMLEVLGQDYIRTAWAKGLPARRVLFRHALRNALIPTITTVGLFLPTLVSGAIVIEAFFGYGGLAQAYYRALGGCLATQINVASCPESGYPIDYPLALVLTLVFVVVIALANALADFLYTLADPRVSMKAKA